MDTPVFSAAMVEILTESFTLDDISTMDVEELAAFLQRRGSGRFGDPFRLANAITKATRDSYRLNKVMHESVDVVLATYALMIKPLQGQVKSLEKAIKEVLETIHDQSLLNIPNAGTIYTLTLKSYTFKSIRFLYAERGLPSTGNPPFLAI